MVVALFTALPLYRLKQVKPRAIFGKEEAGTFWNRSTWVITGAGTLFFLALVLARIQGLKTGLYFILALVALLASFGLVMIYRISSTDARQQAQWFVLGLVLFAVILMVAGYVRGNIYRKLKHPFLAGVKLWALAHLLSNGDLGGIILFGAILAWAVFDRISLKHRTDAGAPAIPTGGLASDIIAVVVGVLVYLALGFYFHPLFIGIPVFGPPPV